MDLLGVTRTIDHAVYNLLNVLAIILWRIDSALMGISLLSYHTQDWLTGRDGGIWKLLARLVGMDGIFGLSTFQAFLVLALTLFGLSRILRPFFRNMKSVDLGRLMFFGVIAYVFITQGPVLLQQAEQWRGEAGGYVYQSLATGESVDLGSLGSGDDLLRRPFDLDGQSPIRGWEAVATSYFLASTGNELHAGVPPEEFRIAYCLYDPAVPIDQQAQENSEGCSPRKAWDEWDMVSTQPITQVWGIPLPIDISLTLPIVEEHPENRQLAIRQAQQGVARLALGPIVALFPIVEANVGLMLALAASFIYLSLPITLMFGFFLYTEPMVTRLFMQFISVFIRTLILNGLLALFMMLLMGVAANGSLTVYLGLVGIGLVGGLFLMRIASGTMKETLSMSMGAIGGVWMGATTGVLGEGARKPAQQTLGVAKIGLGAGAMYLAGRAGARTGIGATSAMADLAEPAFDAARSGVEDVRGRPSARADLARRGGLPAPLASLVGRRGGASPEDRRSPESANPDLDPLSGRDGNIREARPAVPLPAAGWTGQDARRPAPASASSRSGSSTGAQALTTSRASSTGDGQPVEAWAAQAYQASEQGGRGRQQIPLRGQVAEAGRNLVGEERSQEALQAMGRHSQGETMAVLRATREAVADAQARGQPAVRADGSLSPEVVQAVRGRLDNETDRAFTGRQGERDLSALVAAGTVAVQREARQGEAHQATPQVTTGDGRAVEAWAAGMYRAGEQGGRGQRQALEEGRELVGEELSRAAIQAMNRHDREQTLAVLRTARQAAAEIEARGESPVQSDGSLNPRLVEAVRDRLDAKTEQAFAGTRGERDLVALVAAGAAAHREASPQEFRQAMAQARPGQGEQSPGRTVPRALGLDAVASREHFAGMNRFARISEQAGLTEEQRGQLLREVQQQGKVSDGLRREIEATIRQQGSKAAGLSVDDLESGAQALPPTLRGPVAVRLPEGARRTEQRPTSSSALPRSRTTGGGEPHAGDRGERPSRRSDVQPRADRPESEAPVVSGGRVR